MLEHILILVTGFIIQIISTLGYAGVGLLMAVQTIAIPLPSEIIVPFAGYLAFTGRFNIWFIAISGATGSCVGASIAYWIGFKGGRPLVEKYGRVILISRHDLDIADKFFSRHGSKAAFFGMTLPVFRSFIAFPAGISRLPLKKFLPYVFLGSFIWSLLLAFLGMKLGESWLSLRDKFHNMDLLIVLIIIIGAAWWILRHIKHFRQQR